MTYKGITFGCQDKDRYPNFFLPQGCCCLSKATWAMLDDFFEFTTYEVDDKHITGQMYRIGSLPDEITKKLLDCAIYCEDISTSQSIELNEMLKQLEG